VGRRRPVLAGGAGSRLEARPSKQARRVAGRPIIAGRFGPLRGDVRSPAFQAFLLLWIAFTVAPILFGIDKFFN